MRSRGKLKFRHSLIILFTFLGIILIGILVNGRSTSELKPNVAPSLQASTQAAALTLPKDFTLADKIGQLLIVGVTSQATAVNIEKSYQIGGFLLRPQHGLLRKSVTSAIAKAGQLPPLFAVDQEGGQIARLPGKNFSLYSAKYMGGLSDTKVQQIGRQMGQAIAKIGANLDLAPVVDVDNGHNTAISQLDRSFSSDPAVVAQKALAFAKGLSSTSIAPTFKHFPGLGRADGITMGNTDTGSATTPSLISLEQDDLLPYASVLQPSRTSLVMVGNQIVPGLTNGKPASLSPASYELLRSRYGFNQVATTDELIKAKAIKVLGQSSSATIIAAIKAGADMPLVNLKDAQAVGVVIKAVVKAVHSGQLSETKIDLSLQRILQLKTSLQK